MHEMTTQPPLGGLVADSPILGTQPDLQDTIATVELPAIKIGNAKKYWIELLPYPSDSARHLWLLVDDSWKNLNNPSASTSDIVQRAFLGTGSTISVWYNGSKIVGLIVTGS